MYFKVTEAVEVTVALPEKKKAKRKTFDVEAYVRREIQKARRENQELLHKAHFLCMLAHLRYLSGKVSASKVALGCALSVVPKVSDIDGSKGSQSHTPNMTYMGHHSS